MLYALRDWKPAINQFMIMYQDTGCLILFNGGLHGFFYTFLEKYTWILKKVETFLDHI